MTTRIAVTLGIVILAAAGCADPPREWLKVNQPYTTEEFRRDIAACTKKGELDEECMKGRGWVSLSPQRIEKPAEPLRTPQPKK